jgi:hypothetical protein
VEWGVTTSILQVEGVEKEETAECREREERYGRRPGKRSGVKEAEVKKWFETASFY